MNWATEIRSEFARLNKQVDEAVVDEMTQHAEAAWETAIAGGEPAIEAEKRIRALIRSWCQSTSGPQRTARPALAEAAPAAASPFAGLSLDIRQALRLARRQPGVTFMSVFMIGLGIGVTCTLFSLVNGVLLKPLPWKTADRLVRVYENRVEIAPDSWTHTLTNVTYNAWADRPQTIDGVAGWRDDELMLAGDSGVERISAAYVTATLFPLLGVAPLIGENFTEEDARTNNSVILAYGFWQERYGGARDVLGKQIMLSGRPRTIRAVMPRGFEFPTPEARMWMPLEVPSAALPDGRRRVQTFNGLARLKPGVTPEQAASEGAARLNGVPIAADLEWMLPSIVGVSPAQRVSVVRMLDWVVKDVKTALWILLTAGGLLFAAAIGTVVNLQLAQATARRKEVAIRSAIGAGTGRLARQLFVETLTVAATGGALGLALTALLLRALPVFLPLDFPRVQNLAVDARVLALVVALTLAVSLAIGLLPARMARRLTFTGALAEDGSAPIGQSLRSPAGRSRSLVITAQVAIATVLLVGAALLSQSFSRLLGADRGYTPGNLLTARIGFLGAGLPPGSRATFYRDVLERLAAIRGVTHVGHTDRLPLATANWRIAVDLDPGDAKSPNARVDVVYRIISEDYFAAMGIRLLSGRGFNRYDTASSEPVVVVNQTFARQNLAGHPLGVHVRPDLLQYRPDVNRWRIVGVVADVQNGSPAEAIQPEIYAPVAQMTRSYPAQFLTARTERDPAILATELRAIVHAASRNAVIDQVITMEGRLKTSLSRPRLYAVMIGGFSSFAVLIAGVGLFGGLAYGVTQRRREIGIRTALGATPRDIVGLVVRQGAIMSLAGLLAGLAVAASTGRFLAGFLFGVKATDPATFASVSIVLLLVAMLACAVPARRASKVDPVDALRG
jgi:putative ABC transport system permease protein